MSEGSMFVERRTHQRVKVEDGVAAVSLSSSTKFGKISDISLGGIAVRHFDEDEWERKSFEIDIMLADGDLCLNKVSIDVRFDIEKENDSLFMPLSERKCGVKFSDLTPNQTLLLEHFIKNQATDGE